jgi:hypothetical protein
VIEYYVQEIGHPTLEDTLLDFISMNNEQ